MIGYCLLPDDKSVAHVARGILASDLLGVRVAVQRCIGASTLLKVVDNATGSIELRWAEGASDASLVAWHAGIVLYMLSGGGLLLRSVVVYV